MPSFQSIFLVTATALAALTSAVPFGGSNSNVVRTVDVGLTKVVEVAGIAKVEEKVHAHVKRGDAAATTIPLILADIQVALPLVLVNLRASVATATNAHAGSKDTAKVAASVVIPHLLEVKAIIDKAVVQLASIAKLPLDEILVDNGKLLTVEGLADIVVGLLGSVISILNLAVGVVAVGQVTVVVGQVGAVVVGLLNGLLGIVANLKLNIAASVAADIRVLGLVNILALVGVVV